MPRLASSRWGEWSPARRKGGAATGWTARRPRKVEPRRLDDALSLQSSVCGEDILPRNPCPRHSPPNSNYHFAEPLGIPHAFAYTHLPTWSPRRTSSTTSCRNSPQPFRSKTWTSHWPPRSSTALWGAASTIILGMLAVMVSQRCVVRNFVPGGSGDRSQCSLRATRDDCQTGERRLNEQPTYSLIRRRPPPILEQMSQFGCHGTPTLVDRQAYH